jgi:hypothetical protein
LLACEKWVSNNKIIIAKVPPELLAKKLVDLRGKKYNYSNFILSIKEKFLLHAYEIEEIYQKILEINKVYYDEKKRLNKILIRIQNYPPYIREKAQDLLKYGDPQNFINQTFKKKHVGDDMLGETLAVCAASTFIIGKNSGLSVKISGDSGKGKSSAVEAFLDLIPSSMLIKGSLSDKYLFYTDDMQAGSICLVDDKELSEPMKELVKSSITNFQKSEHHRTVINGEPRDLTAKERTVYIFASIDGFDDEQINNRLIQAEIDSSKEQDSKVAAFQRQSENIDISSRFKDDVEICKCIYDLLGLRTYDIRIPFSDVIIWNHEQNRRNQPKFFDIIRAVCLYKIHQREQVNGYYLSTIEDYHRAYEIYQKTTIQNNINLTNSEQRIITCFVQENKAKKFYDNPKSENAVRLTYEQMEELTGIHASYLRKLINGKTAQSLGLGGKVKGLGSESSIDGKRKKLFFYTGTASFEIYEKFFGLSSEEKIREAIEKSIETYEQATNEENEITREAFMELTDSLPSLPAINQALLLKKVTDIGEKNNLSIINNIIKEDIVTLEKKKDPASQIITHILEVEKLENLKENICNFSENTLISENQGNSSGKEAIDHEISVTTPKVTVGNGGTIPSPDIENMKVTGTCGIACLPVVLDKTHEYINKNCHSNTLSKPIETHINDFRKLNPEFDHEYMPHLEHAFNKVLESQPPLDNSPKEEVLRVPVQKKKGIEILERTLEAKRKEVAI